MYARKYLLAYLFSLYGTPSPPPTHALLVRGPLLCCESVRNSKLPSTWKAIRKDLMIGSKIGLQSDKKNFFRSTTMVP